MSDSPVVSFGDKISFEWPFLNHQGETETIKRVKGLVVKVAKSSKSKNGSRYKYKVLLEKYDNLVVVTTLKGKDWILLKKMIGSRDIDDFDEEIKKLLIDEVNFKSLNPKINKQAENFLKGLSNCTIDKLEKGLSVFTLGGNSVLPAKLRFGNNLIYVRPNYSSLLKAIRSTESVVLVSNPGIGKSMFQFYYLARICNSELLESNPLPPDSYGSTEPPEVVIRQVGDEDMFIYFIKAKKAYKIKANNDIFDCFDKETTLYLHEPGSSKNEPFWVSAYCSILSTVSPETSRYKEFTKNGARILYMPLPTESDLLVMGKHLRESMGFPDTLNDFYTDNQIKSRYDEFGGIVRYVLPLDQSVLDKIRFDRMSIIRNTDLKTLIYNPNIEDGQISHLIVKYIVSSDFRSVEYDFVSNSVRAQIESNYNKLTCQEKIEFLRKCDEQPDFSFSAARWSIYEQVIADWLSNKNIEFVPIIEISSNGVTKLLEKFKNKFKKLITDNIPTSFQQLESNILYRPRNSGYPLCDFFYKKGKKLVLLQVSVDKSGKRTINKGPIQSFLGKMSELNINQIRYKYCPLPQLAHNAKVLFHSDVTEDLKFKWSIFQFPKSYSN